MPVGFFTGITGTSSVMNEVCKPCFGTGIIWGEESQTYLVSPKLSMTVEQKIQSLVWGDSMTFEGRGVLEKELRELVALVQAAVKP